MTVKRFEEVLGTQVVLLMPFAWSEWVTLGHIDEFQIPFHGSDPAIAYFENGKCLGFITYRKYTREAYITGSYVVPQCRRLGIFKAMFEELKLYCVENKLVRISGGTYDSNEVMKKVYAATGRTKRSENWAYALPLPEDETK